MPGGHGRNNVTVTSPASSTHCPPPDMECFLMPAHETFGGEHAAGISSHVALMASPPSGIRVPPSSTKQYWVALSHRMPSPPQGNSVGKAASASLPLSPKKPP